MNDIAFRAPRANRQILPGLSSLPEESTRSITAAAQEPALMPLYHGKEIADADSAAKGTQLPENNYPRPQSGKRRRDVLAR